MHHTKLGRTGLRVSKLCLGTMTFGLQCDVAQSNAIMDAAYCSIQSKRWEPVVVDDWRGSEDASGKVELTDYDDQHYLIK